MNPKNIQWREDIWQNNVKPLAAFLSNVSTFHELVNCFYAACLFPLPHKGKNEWCFYKLRDQDSTIIEWQLWLNSQEICTKV